MNDKTFEEMVKQSKMTDRNPHDPMWHSEVPTNSVRKVWFLDVQWSDCPEFVEDEVRQLWDDFGLGNDHYIYRFTTGEDEEGTFNYPMIAKWLKYKGVPDGETVIIHWWW